MPRPLKYTVDYFAHDANAGEGKTLSILFNNFGHEGISAWWLLLERISLTDKHALFIQSQEEVEYLAAKLHFLPERLLVILRKMAELNAIDPTLFEHGIIWSDNFVSRLDPLYSKRKLALPPKPSVNHDGNEVNGDGNEVIDDGKPTKESKVKESKVKESKVKESIVEGVGEVTKVPPSGEPPHKNTYGQAKNVHLTDIDYAKLVKKFGKTSTKDRIENLSEYKASKGKQYKSDYYTILSWDRKDEKEGAGKKNGYGKLATEKELKKSWNL
ncbi:Lin1244/Lin1753 domain-containing protein [Chloroflexota bacterium]